VLDPLRVPDDRTDGSFAVHVEHLVTAELVALASKRKSPWR